MLPRLLMIASLLLVSAASPVSDPLADTEEALALFRLDAFLVRDALREGGINAQMGERFWQSAQNFAQIVTDESAADKPLFLPILKGMRATMQEQVLSLDTPDLSAVSGIQQALDEQIRIADTDGIGFGGKSRVELSVIALRNGKSASYGVWIDFPCCVGKTAAMSLPGMTTAKTVVKPGTYAVRLVQGGRVIACKRAIIGRQRPDKVEVDVNDGLACR